MTCTANPGGTDGHTHDIKWLDELSGNGWTAPGGMDGHSHQVVNWTAINPGHGAEPHTHHVSCTYDSGVQGGGGPGCGF